MDIDYMRGLLSQEEDTCLEFKSCRKKLGTSFWQSYSAFSNTAGGVIILGVQEEHSRVKAIIGIENPIKI